MKQWETEPLEEVCILKITLEDIEPPIWRRVIISNEDSLDMLHALIQTSMGWDMEHFYQFKISDRYYSDPEMMDEGDFEDSNEIGLEDLDLKVGDKFTYEYDFGDSWSHLIEVEEIRDIRPFEPSLGCRGGERRCPPENCGGVPGYYEFLEKRSKRKKPRHRDLAKIIGSKDYDPESFDLDEVNSAIQLTLLYDEDEVASILESTDSDDVEEVLASQSSIAAFNQLMADSPPQAREAMIRLENEGVPEDQCFTGVVTVLANEIIETAQSKKPFNMEAYVKKLENLNAETFKDLD